MSIVHDVCVGYIHADVPTRARDRDSRIFGARNRTHVCIAGGAATCTPIIISHPKTYIPIFMSIYYTYTYIYYNICVHDVHAHTHLSHKCTNAYTYMYNAYIYIKYTHIYTYNHISRLSTRSYTCTRGRPRMRLPTRLRTRTRARASVVDAAHTGPRRVDDPPSASRLRWRAAGPKRRHIHRQR